MLHQYIVTEDESDQRVDRFLKKIFSGAPATFFYKMGRTKKVRINGKKTEPGDRIYVSDRVDVYLNAEEFSHYTTFIEPIAKVPNSKILTSAQILYEDDSLLIVDKSPGLNVHPGDHKTTEASLIQLVQDYLWPSSIQRGFTPALIHRIDRDTTGVVMIAKTRAALLFMLEELQSNHIEKWYRAQVYPSLKESSGSIRAPLLRIENAKNENKVRVDPTWQKAITHYRVLQSSDRGDDVEVRLETGRMHQIRVHLAHLGSPVIGDKTYGDPRQVREQRDAGVTRQLLHAWKVVFRHPVTHQKTEVIAPLPIDFLSL